MTLSVTFISFFSFCFRQLWRFLRLVIFMIIIDRQQRKYIFEEIQVISTIPSLVSFDFNF